MTKNTDQRFCIVFCQKFGKTASKTFEKLKELSRDDAMSYTNFFNWNHHFKEALLKMKKSYI